MVDPTAVTVVSGGVKAAGPIARLFMWIGRNWRKWRGYGAPKSDHPPHGDICRDQWVELTGTHDHPTKGHYWLLTSDKENYWLHAALNLKPDGRWTERVTLAEHRDPERPWLISSGSATTHTHFLRTSWPAHTGVLRFGTRCKRNHRRGQIFSAPSSCTSLRRANFGLLSHGC
jgi:hypothetical protein